MDKDSKSLADVSDILARKAEGRREIARRSFAQKIAMIEAMRERLAPLKRSREMRRSGRAGGDDGPAIVA